jgi:hypothetical protein
VAGLPKSIIKKYGVTKRAWKVFRGSRSKRKGGKLAMAGRRRRARFPRARAAYRRGKWRSQSKAIPILPVAAAFGTILAPAVFGGGGYTGALGKFQSEGIQGAVREFTDILAIQTTGYKPSDGSNWGLDKPTATWATIVGALVGHFLANKFGINRSIHKIPIFGKYISL